MSFYHHATLFLLNYFQTENPSAGVAGHALRVSAIIQLKFLFLCLCRPQTKNSKLFYLISSSNPNTDLWRQQQLVQQQVS